MIKMIKEIAHMVFEQNKSTPVEVLLFSDGPKATIEFKEEDFDMDLSDLVEEFKFAVGSTTNYEFQIAKINYIKNGFGFSEGARAFCHITKMVGTDQSFEELCNSGELFVIHSYEGPKGRTASWFCPFNNMDDKTKEKLCPAMYKVILEYESDKALKNYWQERANKRREQIKASLAALGITSYGRTTIEERSTYGGRKEYVYSFNHAIDRETFKSFLKITGQVVEAKPNPYPICAEQVRFDSQDQGITWHYEWMGEWCD